MKLIRLRGALFAFLLCVLVNIYPALAEPGQSDSMKRTLHEEQLAGATWALVEPGRIVTSAAGLSNAQTGTAMKPQDRVHIGSVTKTLLAVGLLRLASQGRLDLDAPVESILPDIDLSNRWNKTDPVRIRHLLDHTAGLEDLRVAQMFSGRVNERDQLMAAFDRHPGALKVRTRPGEIFSYSNIGYGLAGMVVEQITGQPYEQWLDANLLSPLGMKNSTFQFVSQVKHRDAGLAWGHNDDLSLAAALPVALRPAAQFTTTAYDMGLFARFLMGDGSVGNKPFVDHRLLRAMGAPVETVAARAGLQLGYRFGLASRDRHSHIGKCHAGNIVGYRSMLCIYPKEQKAFFYSINTDSETADYARVDKLLIDTLRLSPWPAAPEGKPAADVADWRGRYVPAVSGIGLERYTDFLTESIRFVPHADHAVLKAMGSSPRPLSYMGGHLLRAPDRSGPTHALVRSGNGDRMITDGLRTFRSVPEPLFWALAISLAAGLAALLYATLLLPVLAWRRKWIILQPMTAAPLLLIAGAGLLYVQPFEQFGDRTGGSWLLAAGSVALPLGAVVQAALALRRRPRFWSLDLASALLLLQWSAILALFGLLPLVLWA